MIKEDYVSFEVAKLLKEKGFDWDCITYYVDYEPNDVKYSMLFENNTTWEKRCYSAPTHQMVCKWLREVYHWHIAIERGPIGYHINITSVPNGIVCYITPEITGNRYVNIYEEAVEAALKYTLEALI